MSFSKRWFGNSGAVIPPPPSFIVQDTFTRTSAVSLGSADTGQAWTAHSGTWGTNGTQGYLVTQSGDSVATVNAGVSDFDMSCDVTIVNAPGLVFRASDNLNYLLMLRSGSLFQLWQRVAGGYGMLTQATFNVAGLHTLRVTGVGTAITFYVDGTSVLTWTTSQFQTNTRFGLRQNDSAADRYDNFTVR